MELAYRTALNFGVGMIMWSILFFIFDKSVSAFSAGLSVGIISTLIGLSIKLNLKLWYPNER